MVVSGGGVACVLEHVAARRVVAWRNKSGVH